MKRTFHTWDKWECYRAGLYENQPKQEMTPQECEHAYRDLLRETPMFEAALFTVVTEWRNSCEHYLSNERMNRIAWLGQAALCVARGIPSVYRGGFNLLLPTEQHEANTTALRFLNMWLDKRGEPPVDMEGAGVNAQVNLY